MPAVEVTGLTVRYGPAGTPAAVDDLDLTAEAAEVLVVLGPNGAGKTSTVETLEGYRRPVAGTARVLGLDPVADHAALSGRVGVMLQRGGVYPMLGPHRVLRLFAGYYPDPVPTDELLDLVGLHAVAATPWRHLSGESSSGSPLPSPWSVAPRWPSSTSRRPASTPRAASPCAPWWRG